MKAILEMLKQFRAMLKSISKVQETFIRLFCLLFHMIASGCNTFTVFWKWCIKSKYSKFRLDGVTLQLLLNITTAV